ncbi:MAG: hypothetical protein O6920_05250 [Chloroflexi bacterium]|nr:hypothetical protein [Chloroflexota bacterium]
MGGAPATGLLKERSMAEEIISMDDMAEIFELTDSLDIDREAIRVELSKEDPGSVARQPDGLIEMVVPLTTPLASWLQTLEAELRRMGYG